MTKFTVLIIFLVYSVIGKKVENSKNVSSEETTTSKLQKRLLSTYGVGQSFQVPYRPSYPLLAQITPLNEYQQQMSDSFIGYIYSSVISPIYYPYYSVLCRKESKTETNSINDIQMMNEIHLKPLKEKITELNEKMKILTNLFNDTNLQSKFKQQTIEHSSRVPKNYLKDPEIAAYPEKSGTKSIEKEKNLLSNIQPFTMPPMPNFNLKPQTSSDKSFPKTSHNLIKVGPNSNLQINVFQCEGVTCPEQTESCRIVEHAVEPRYEEILMTVFCMSNNNVLLKAENKYPNPKKGSSKESSRTVDRQSGDEIDREIEKTFAKAFGTKFFQN